MHLRQPLRPCPISATGNRGAAQTQSHPSGERAGRRREPEQEAKGASLAPHPVGHEALSPYGFLKFI